MSRRTAALTVALLTLGALGLRLSGLGFGLPVALELDCKIPVQAELLRASEEERRADSELRWYPLLLARIAALAPPGEPAPAAAPLEEHLAAAARPHLVTRALVALLSVLVVPLAYRLGRLVTARGPAVFAAALCAFSLLGQSFAQQSRPHAPSAFFFLLAVLACVRLRRRGTAAAYLGAGAATALAIGCLQSGVVTLGSLVAACALRPGGARTLLDPRGLLALLPLALAVPLFYPFVLWDDAVGADGSVVQLGGHLIFLEQFRGEGLAILARTMWFYEPVLLALVGVAVLSFFGGAPATRGREGRGRDVLVVLAFALPYLVATALYERSYERFVLPLVPCLAAFAAWGAARWAARLPGRAAVASALALLALPAFACLRLAAVRAAPHTTERAAEWVAANVAAGEPVWLTPTLDLPLGRGRDGMRFWGERTDTRRFFFVPWTRYQAVHTPDGGPEPRRDLRWMAPGRIVADPVGYVGELGGWAVVEVFAENRTHPSGTRLREALAGSAELALRISPDGTDDYSEHPLGYQEETSVVPPHFLRRVLQARGTGPVIEIYRLPGG